MNQTISIFIYSYQNKNLIDFIDNLINLSSKKNKLLINIIDQNNIDRSLKFNRYDNVDILYRHIFWDSITSPIVYKKIFLDSCISGYYLQISDTIFLSQNWDEYLIENVSENIISGYNEIEIQFKNLFMVKPNKKIINSITQTDWIDRDLIFSKVEIIKKVSYPDFLKYYGEEEFMSFIAFLNNISIYAIPSELIKKEKDSFIDDYKIFSLTHKYNEFLNFLKQSNKINEFSKKHKFNFLELKEIPFNDNDPNYNLPRSKFDSVMADRYLQKTRRID